MKARTKIREILASNSTQADELAAMVQATADHAALRSRERRRLILAAVGSHNMSRPAQA